MSDKFNSTNYKRQFNEQNYERIGLTIKKGTKQAIKAVADEKGESINSYIKTAVTARYEADTGNDIDL